MTDFQLFKQINSLPKELKQEVNDFVEFLNHKANLKKKNKTKKVRIC